MAAIVRALDDKHKGLPMHMAAEFGHLEFVKALIPCWTNMWAKNQDGKTALQIAESKGHHEIAKLLQTKIKTDAATSALNHVMNLYDHVQR